jgi:hypothetical protein
VQQVHLRRRRRPAHHAHPVPVARQVRHLGGGEGGAGARVLVARWIEGWVEGGSKFRFFGGVD